VESSEAIVGRAAAAEADGDERWQLVVLLHRRGDAATFHAAVALLDSGDPDRRRLGADILAQLGSGPGIEVTDRPWARPTVELLLEPIENETDLDVLQAIATAFGHLSDPRCVPALRRLRHHPSANVRHSVVFGLLGLDSDLAVETLIELSSDNEEHVRGWATFGLATQLDRDDGALRGALLARLHDSDDVTRGEALRGLAKRGDRRAIPVLINECAARSANSRGPEFDWSLIDEAVLALAASTADPRLCSQVVEMVDEWQADCPGEPLRAGLKSAIDACRLGGTEPDPR
jgi:HEAT repeat protein